MRQFPAVLGCGAAPPVLARRARALPPLARAAPPSLLRNVATRAEGDNGAAQAKGKGKGKNKGEEEPPSAYRDTVILPDTPFSMRANSKTREPELQAYWAERRIYERLLARNESGGSFVLHDGPPYANGDLHVGHALNKVLKDVVLKYHLISGRQARFVPGWDCHGLPIELKVLQTLSESERAGLTPLGLRARAAAFAKEAVDRQMAGFKRYGVWGDWDQPYLTLQPEYEAAQIGVFAAMATNGHIYRGKKPVHWSPSSRTALAEAELEYPEGHTSPSIYVSMPATDVSDKVPSDLRTAMVSEGASFMVWTTTPWTIPANLAVAVNDRLDYAVCRVTAVEGSKAVAPEGLVIIAKDLVDSLCAKFGWKADIVGVATGAMLEGSTYKHPLYDRTSPVVVGGDYITTESGTGLVHTAPGHGQEDYQVGMRYNLGLLSPVDEAGRFTAEAGARFEGMAVQEEGNRAVTEALQECGCLVMQERYQHKYPYDWRTKKPTIFRTTEQWFASVEGFRNAALDAAKAVEFVPSAGANRLMAMVEGRSDWCISRQRKWGVPIPVFYHRQTGEPLMTPETMGHVQKVVAERGSDAWWEMGEAELLPESHRHLAADYRKGEDTMDVWFDSGSSWAGVLSARDNLTFPADLYLEGSDQHRGWFQSSLLTAVAAMGQAPYRAVVTHGFVLDEKGMKMSKSLGNTVDPRAVIEGGRDEKKEPAYGADVLRLWVSSVDYTSDVMIGPGILRQVFDVYRKVRTTVRFLLGTISDFDPLVHSVPLHSLPPLDRHALALHWRFMRRARDAYSSYQFVKVYQGLQSWCSADLSNFYLDVVKDRLYLEGRDAVGRRACQTTLYHITRGLLSAVAPILPHLAEDAWQSMGLARGEEDPDSVFLAGWPAEPETPESAPESGIADLDVAFVAVRGVRDVANRALEQARRDKVVGSSLDAQLSVLVEDPPSRAILASALPESLDGVGGSLRKVCIVSQAALVDAIPTQMAFVEEGQVEGLGRVVVGVGRAEGAKCERCWVYDVKVGSFSDHPTLCPRCHGVVTRGLVKDKVAATNAA